MSGEPAPASAKWGDLGVRAASAAVLIPAVLADVWMGEEKTVGLLATEDYVAGMHADGVDGIRGTVVYKSPLMAPLKEGDVVGDLIVTAPGVGAVKIPVAAGAAVNEMGFFGKAMFGLKGD